MTSVAFKPNRQLLAEGAGGRELLTLDTNTVAASWPKLQTWLRATATFTEREQLQLELVDAGGDRLCLGPGAWSELARAPDYATMRRTLASLCRFDSAVTVDDELVVDFLSAADDALNAAVGAASGPRTVRFSLRTWEKILTPGDHYGDARSPMEQALISPGDADPPLPAPRVVLANRLEDRALVDDKTVAIARLQSTAVLRDLPDSLRSDEDVVAAAMAHAGPLAFADALEPAASSAWLVQRYFAQGGAWSALPAARVQATAVVLAALQTGPVPDDAAVSRALYDGRLSVTETMLDRVKHALVSGWAQAVLDHDPNFFQGHTALAQKVVAIDATFYDPLMALGFAVARELQPPWALARYDFARASVLDFDGSALGACLARVVSEQPSASSRMDQMNRPFAVKDFLYYLGAVRWRDRNNDYQTGKEPQLKQWILAQPDNSIDPVKLFRESLTLNGGNVWNAVLTSYQLLRLESRWWWPPIYTYQSSYAAQRTLFNKMIDIRGDLRERGGAFTGEHAGSWYRIWGMMLYQMARAGNANFDRALHDSEPSLSSGTAVLLSEASLESEALGSVVEWPKPVIDDEDDLSKGHINRAAADAATSMLRHIESGDAKSAASEEQCRDPATYLKPER